MSFTPLSQADSVKLTGLCMLLRVGIPHMAHLYNSTVICFVIWKNKGYNKYDFIRTYSDVMHELQNVLGMGTQLPNKRGQYHSGVYYLHRNFTCKRWSWLISQSLKFKWEKEYSFLSRGESSQKSCKSGIIQPDSNSAGHSELVFFFQAEAHIHWTDGPMFMK